MPTDQKSPEWNGGHVGPAEARPPFACFRVASPEGDFRGRWLRFGPPAALTVARATSEIPAVLNALDAADAENRWAIAFLAYESAGALDSALRTKPAGEGPLAACATFDGAPVCMSDLPAAPRAPEAIEWRAEIDAAAHAQAVRSIRERIAAGDTYQVNFTFRLLGPAPNDPWGGFCRLAQAHPTPYAAWLALPDWIAVSFSPELFFAVQRDRIVCRPMKGTAARGRWFEEDEEHRRGLQRSAKDRAENVMIVDMVRNDLGRIARPHTIGVGPLCAVETYRSVFQMVSTVRGKTEAPPSAILHALFPCASITGAPKARTMEIIADLERSPRGLYCGALGFIAPGRVMRFSVPIRTLVIHPRSRRAEYGIGGGIVWDSSAEAEYAEARDKALVLTRPDPPFELIETLRWRRDRGPFLWREHYDRLLRSARYFDFRLPDEADVLRRLQRAVEKRTAPRLRVRLLYGETGDVHFEIAPLPDRPDRQPVRIVLDDRPTDAQSRWLYHKTTVRAVYDAARARHPQADDVVLWNEDRGVMETSIANIVARLDGTWVTPPVASGLLPGTMRARLLRRGCVRERAIATEDLRRAERIVLINSVRGPREARLAPA